MLGDSHVEAFQELVEICQLHPDVIEWCPSSGFEDWLAWGMYQHNEDTNERQGALVVARLECDSGSASLQLQTNISSPGVYDLAWSSSPLLLMCACADGAVRLYHAQPEITEIAQNQLSDCILTHLCWGAGEADGIVVVGQDGVLHHLKAGTEIRRVASRQQHNLEAWCVEVSHADRNLIVSGADDSLLLGWDLRSPDASPTFSNRSHEAGVTSLACSPHNDFQILSGSYDERLRLFDLRHMKEPLIRSNRLGDGAYQLSWHTKRGVFAVAAMRCGFPIFELDEAGTFQRLGGYCESAGEGCHGSLGYGISWQYLGHLTSRRV